MPFRPTYANQLNDPLTASNSIASFTGPQNLIKVSGGATYVAQPTIIPVNYLKTGTTIRTHASGTYANASTTPTMSWQLTYGASTVLAVSSVVTETSGATIQVPWWLDLWTEVRSAAIQSAVVTVTHGTLTYSTTLSAQCLVFPVPVIALATVNVDNTAAGELWVGATCGTSAAGNTITLHTLVYEELTQI
jgi:hypothetical protein